MEILVTLGIVRVKTKSGYRYEVWENGSALVRMGDWERLIVTYKSKDNAKKYVKHYANKLRKQYGEHISIKII